MSQPLPPIGPDPLPELPQPFTGEPQPVLGGGRAGCGRVAMLGCGGLLVLVAVGAVLLSLRADEMLVWVMRKLESQVAAGLPADLPPAERERLEGGFTDLYRAIGDGEVDPAALQALQRELMSMSGDVGRGLTREQVEELTIALERAAGKRPSGTDPPG